jgi:hypothetical protein
MPRQEQAFFGSPFIPDLSLEKPIDFTDKIM